MLHSVCDEPDLDSVHAQFDRLLYYVEGKLPAVATLLDAARDGILAFGDFPRDVSQRI
jgi:putative transposase